MIVGEVSWVFPSPNQMTRPADEDHGSRVEQAVLIVEVMGVAARTATDMAAAPVVLPDRFSEQLPLACL